VRKLFAIWGALLAATLGTANFLGWRLPWDDEAGYDAPVDVRSNPRLYHMQSHAK
jgi:hypothetical protein